MHVSSLTACLRNVLTDETSCSYKSDVSFIAVVGGRLVLITRVIKHMTKY